MPEEPEHHSYLPVHNGMPTSPPCSQPVKLMSASAVEAFLAGTPFYLYRIQLLTPFEGSQTVVSAILKEIHEHCMGGGTPVEAMTRIRPWLSSTLPVKVPKIHHFDAHNNLIIMEDCGADVITLREFLCSGSASSTDLAETIGVAIGEFIALSLQAKKTTADLYYDHIVATLQCADKDDLTLLSGFKVDPSDIQVISKLTDEYRSLLMSARVPGRDVFLMGDLWYENILLNANEHPLRLYILDWELARIGLPGSDIGVFCACMDLLGRGNQVAYKPASVMLQSFIEAYSRISNRDMRLAQDTLVHWGITYVSWAPRDPPDDRKLLQDFVREGVEILVHFRDKDFLAQSPVKGLLPK
ncbi:Protein kinase-like domain containing protein [Amanita muscaria]